MTSLNSVHDPPPVEGPARVWLVGSERSELLREAFLVSRRKRGVSLRRTFTLTRGSYCKKKVRRLFRAAHFGGKQARPPSSASTAVKHITQNNRNTPSSAALPRASFSGMFRQSKNEWELFTGQLGSVAGASEAGRPRGFPPWASPDREEAFGLLAEYLPHLVQSADLADAER